MSNRRVLILWFEFMLLFGGVPLLLLLLKDRWLTVGLLWGGAAGAFLYNRRLGHGGDPAAKLVPDNIKNVLLRFAILAPVLSGLTWLSFPGWFLSFPRERPGLWILVMVLYPVLSVVPQEMIYRAFIHRRYAPLFGPRAGYIFASALAFGFMHIIFINIFAVVLSAAGGFLFAWNYARSRSLALVSLEHTLYGCLIFTVGLGRFFFTGYAWG